MCRFARSSGEFAVDAMHERKYQQVMAIDALNAKECQQKSVEARKLHQEEKRIANELALIAAMREQLPEYQTKRLGRVRLQLDRLDQMLMTETDPQKLDRLASAQSRLSEQERQLSNRPLPGTLRPQSPGKRSKLATPEPIQPNEIPPP